MHAHIDYRFLDGIAKPRIRARVMSARAWTPARQPAAAGATRRRRSPNHPNTRLKILSTLRSGRWRSKACSSVSGFTFDGDLGLVHDELAEVQVFLPGFHGVALHQPVRVFAQHAGLDQVEQKLSAEDQAAGGLQVLQHALGIDQHGVDEVGRLVRAGSRARMVESGRMTRSTDECEMSRSCQSGNVFQRRLRVGADHARQSTDLLAGDRVALVRHRRRALLLLAEKFFGLADFGALQVADFGGDLVRAWRRSPPASPRRRHGGRAG